MRKRHKSLAKLGPTRKPTVGARIRAPIILPKKQQAGWVDISTFPGFDSQLRGRRLRLCIDNDVSDVIVSSLDGMGIKVRERARDAGIGTHDDYDIAAWAKRLNTVLLTCNHWDFWPEKHHKIHMCSGIIAVGMENNGSNNGQIVRMMANINSQLFGFVRNDWWRGTKIKLLNEQYLIRQFVNGVQSDYRIEPTGNGRLRFQRKNRR